jgi:hypothetical protein
LQFYQEIHPKELTITHLYAIIRIQMSGPIIYADNEGQMSVEAQAKADVVRYSEILTEQYGYDPNLINDFVNYAEILGIKQSNHHTEANPVYTASHLESVLLAMNYDFKPQYGHLKTRSKGASRSRVTDSDEIMGNLTEIFGNTENAMVRTKAVKAGVDFAVYNVGTPFSFLIKSQKVVDMQTLGSRVVANSAQVELLISVQDCVDAVRAVGSRKEGAIAAQALIGRIPELTHLNPEKILYLVAEMIETIKRLEQNEEKPSVKKLYHNVTIKLAASIEYVTTSRAFDKFLQPIEDITSSQDNNETEVTTEPSTEVSEVADSLEAPIEVLTKETPTEVLSELESLVSEINIHNHYWFDIGRKWRENNFSPLMEDIVRNRQLLDKVGAPQMIGVLARINVSAIQDQQNAVEVLKTAQGKAQDLYSRVQALTSQYGQFDEVKQFSKGLFIINVPLLAHQARENWMQFAQSIRLNWPDANGADSAQRIQNVLFDGEYQSDSSEQDLVQHDIEPTVSIDTAEIDTLRTLVEQLDEIILPPGMTEHHLIQQLRELGVERSERINWEKFKDLVILTKEFGGKIFRSKLRRSGESDGYGEVYYVSVFELYGKRFAIAESPVIKNATYVIDETHSPGSWTEMLTLDKSQVRELGGKQIIHASASPYGPLHREKVIKYVFDVAAE